MDKKEAILSAMKQIEKAFGKGSIMRLGDNISTLKVQTVSTGILPIDLATGIGGLPRGRIIEVYGPESSGKTTVALHMIAEIQKKGGEAAFIDAENALDVMYAKNLGVDIDSLLLSQPDSGEQALEIVDALTRSAAIDIIVVDSVAALVPQAEIDGDMGSSQVGLHARMMSKAMRKLAGNINKTNTIVVFINQVREKVGLMFGNPEITTGGRALKFYATIRMEIRKGEVLKQGTEIIGNRIKVKISKNKVSAPFKTAEFDIMFGTGYSIEGAVLDLGVEQDIIEKSGSYFSYKGERLGQGKENAKKYLAAHPEILEEIDSKVRESIFKSGDNIVLAEDEIEEMPEDYNGVEE